MANFCANCGHELREGDKFCAKCGTTVGGTAPQTQSAPWEYCEILFNTGQPHWWRGAGHDAYFYAKGRRDDDTYEIARTSPFQAKTENLTGGDYLILPPKSARGRFDELVKVLTADGWEQMHEKAGEWWWQVKFHRRVSR